MELRSLKITLAAILLAACLQYAESRHSVARRSTDLDMFANDEASDNDESADDEINPATISNTGSTYQVASGGNVTLQCIIKTDAKDLSNVVLSWLIKDKVISMGNMIITYSTKFSIVNDTNSVFAYNLFIKDVNPEDSGMYRCEIGQPDRPSIEHKLIVTTKPEITAYTASGGVLDEGSSVNISCRAKGFPAPTFIWSLQRTDGNVNLRTDESKNGFSYYYIEKLKAEDSGTYLCYALNAIGQSDTKAIEVIVRRKMKVHVHKTIVNAAKNVSEILQCEVHHENRPEITWYKDGLPMDSYQSYGYKVQTSDHQSNLTVTPVNDEDFGNFTCEARNSRGVHSRSVELVQNPVVENINVDGNKLTWEVHSHQPLKKVELQFQELAEDPHRKNIEVALAPAHGHIYKFAYVLSEDNIVQGKYQAYIKAKNSYGFSKIDDPIIVNVEEEEAQSIQHASVFYSTDGAASFRPAASVLSSTILMYLLVRLF